MQHSELKFIELETPTGIVKIAHGELEQLEAKYNKFIESKEDHLIELTTASGDRFYIPLSNVKSFCEDTARGREARWASDQEIAHRQAELYPEWIE